MDGNSDRKLQTLYLLLAEPAPESSERGRTPETRAKETVDNDVEAFWPDSLAGA